MNIADRLARRCDNFILVANIYMVILIADFNDYVTLAACLITFALEARAVSSIKEYRRYRETFVDIDSSTVVEIIESGGDEK